WKSLAEKRLGFSTFTTGPTVTIFRYDHCHAKNYKGWPREQKDAAKPPFLSGRGGRFRAMFGMHSWNMVCERPPRLRRIRWLRDIFLQGAATPPHEEGI